MKRAVFYGCAVGFVLVLAIETSRVVLGNNFHTVEPGRVYRCAQPSLASLKQMVSCYGIRTVINLRGTSEFDTYGIVEPQSWYMAECQATQRLDLSQEDISFSAQRMPGVNEVRRLIEVFDQAEYPILLHCRQGADRTGLAACMYLLLQPNTTLKKARAQLGLRYGHVPLARTAFLDRFFRFYVDWLQEQGIEHSAAAFRHWAIRVYCPDVCRASLELLNAPLSLPCGRPTSLRIRCTNASHGVWRFRQDYRAGVHAYYMLWNERGEQVHTDRGGLFNAEVAPGEYIDLTLALPPVRVPGTYRLLVDMVDEQHCCFCRVGSEPLDLELTFRE